MISGFSDVRYQFPPTTPAYRGTPYGDYWFYHLLLGTRGEAFDTANNRVSTDVADKHARYISEIAT